MKNAISEQIQKLHTEASNLASAEVIRIARKILNEHSELKEFVMGMGLWSFSDYDGHSYLLENGTDPRFAELEDFISEWDSEIRITGEPMRFTANGKIIRNW